MRIYYDLVIWEEVDQNDSEKLKGKMLEMAKRFQGYGVLSFNMRAAPIQQEVEAQQAQPQQPHQYQYQPEYEEEEVQPQRTQQPQQPQQQPKQVKRQVQEVSEEIIDE